MKKPQFIQIAIVLLFLVSLTFPIKTIGETTSPNVPIPDIPTPETPTLPTVPPELPSPSVPQVPDLPNPNYPSLPPGINPPKNPQTITPVAEAGPDKTVAVGWVVQFDASASYDPNNRPLNYSWYFNWTYSLPQQPIAPPNTTTPQIPDIPNTPTPTIPDVPLPESPVPEVPLPSQSLDQSPEVPIEKPQIPDTPSTPSLPTSSIPLPDSHEKMPTHVYNATGVFTVLLIVSNGITLSTDTLNVTVLEHINRPPTANAGLNRVVSAYDVVRFDGSKSTDPDNDTLYYLWDFGDNTTGEGMKTTHTYREWGIFYVTLTVRDREFSDTDTIKVVVKEINIPPIAVAGENQTVEVNDVVYFDGGNSYDKNDNPMRGYDVKPDYVIQSYSWDFGDGTKGYGIQTKHLYVVPGTYQVVLTVSDREFSSTDTIYVIVKHLHSVVLSAENNNIQAQPGDTISTKITVTNVGTTSENVSLTVSTYFKDWLRLEKNSTVMEVQQTKNVALSINIPSSAKAGTYDFIITSFVPNMSKKSLNPSTSLTVSITQKPKIVLSSDADILTMKPSEHRTINISIKNEGNGGDAVSLDADGELKQYIAFPKNPSFIIKENTTKTIQIDITAPSNATQKRYDAEIVVFSESGGVTTLKIRINVMSTVKDEKVPGFEILYVIGAFFASILLFTRKKKAK
jgi:PKD repeat protein